ncbi:MAG: hypothetical protein KME23_24015 [Goleter apudmare HA4340-LM2]|jgi:ferrous iron transport protein B|nr:hypothetical protein [Goleter apudmare HA4340-LM2]
MAKPFAIAFGSFILLIMDFGCNMPAIMGTRVMRSRPLRLLNILIIPFALLIFV